MFNSNTDKDWERFGQLDPYFGVMTSDKFRKENLTEENKASFFESGREYVEQVLDNVRRYIDPQFAVKRALDFGCGVGRLVIPLASIAEEVTGVDVSESMLQEARRNCESRAITNAVFLRSDDRLSLVRSRYDFIHSYIVFQHIPVRRGERILRGLIERLEEGGVAVVHFTYAKDDPFARGLSLIKSYVPFARNVASLLAGRGFFAPQMQMNAYDLNRLLSLIQSAGVAGLHVDFTRHKGGVSGVVLYFQKPAEAGAVDLRKTT